MALSIREQALAGLKTALDGITGVPGVQVLRNEDTAVERFPTLIQVDAESTQRVVERAAGVTVYALELTVEGYVSASLPAETGPALSDLYARAWQAAKGAEAAVAAIFEVREGETTTALVREDGVAPHAVFALTVALGFGARPDDPFTPA